MFQFSHFDPNLAASVESGLARLRASDWQSGPDTAQLRDWEAVLALKAILIGHLLGSVTYSTDANGVTVATIAGDVAGSDERSLAAQALLSPVQFYWQAAGLPAPVDDGNFESIAPTDVGMWPLAVMIIVAVAGTAILGYGLKLGADLVQYFHTQNVQVSEIHRLDAAATDVLNKHVQDEVATKTIKPLTPAETQTVASLNARIADLQKGISQPPAPPTFLSSIPSWGWAIAGAAGAALLIRALTSSGSPVVVMPSRAAA